MKTNNNMQFKNNDKIKTNIASLTEHTGTEESVQHINYSQCLPEA